MGRQKEAQISNLLRNVNFFQAEKQLLIQKGIKLHSVTSGTNPQHHKHKSDPFEVQAIEPLDCPGSFTSG